MVWTQSAYYKKSRTEKGSSRDFELRFFLKFILAMPKALYVSTKSDKTAYNVSSFLGKHRLRRRKIGILSCFRVKCVVFFAFLAKAPLCSRTILSRIHLIFCFSTMRTFSSCYFFCFSHIFIISYCALFVHTCAGGAAPDRI